LIESDSESGAKEYVIETSIPLKSSIKRSKVDRQRSPETSQKFLKKNYSKKRVKKRERSPVPEDSNKVVIFNENEIKEFMVKVWEEMTVNYGIIEDLQDQLDEIPKSRSPNRKLTKSRKSSVKKSRSIKKSNSKLKLKKKKLNSSKKKKIQRSKGRKKKIKLDSTNSSNEIKISKKRKKKLKKMKMMKMNTLNRRSNTTDNIKKQAFSTKPKGKSRKRKGRQLMTRTIR
jgi:hypothetical protein